MFFFIEFSLTLIAVLVETITESSASISWSSDVGDIPIGPYYLAVTKEEFPFFVIANVTTTASTYRLSRLISNTKYNVSLVRMKDNMTSKSSECTFKTVGKVFS